MQRTRQGAAACEQSRKSKTAAEPPFRPLQRNASLRALLLVALRALEKKQEPPERANSLEKKRAKLEVEVVLEKLPEQIAVSSAHDGRRSPRRHPDARTKQTTRT